MKNIKRFISLLILVLFLVGMLSSTGCTKYASEDQLKALEDAKNAALSAERRVEELKAEKAQLEKDIAAKRQELRKLTRDRDAVR